MASLHDLIRLTSRLAWHNLFLVVCRRKMHRRAKQGQQLQQKAARSVMLAAARLWHARCL